MKIKYLQAAAALAAALSSAATAALAQEQKPAQAPVPPPLQAPAQPPAGAPIQPGTQQPDDERDPLIRWGRGQMDVREMLRALDQACPQQILIGEGVSGRVEHNGRPMRLSKFLDTLCWAANLSWGYLNHDTIVVLRARPNQLSSGTGPLLVIPRVMPNPLNPLVPRGPVTPLNPDPRFEQGRRPSGVPENARPRTFNGQSYYIIPLQPAPDITQSPAENPPAAPVPNEQPER